MNYRANLNVAEKETSLIPVRNSTHNDRSSISYLGECSSFFLIVSISSHLLLFGLLLHICGIKGECYISFATTFIPGIMEVVKPFPRI